MKVKKVLIFLIIGCLMFSVAGCGKKETQNKNENGKKQEEVKKVKIIDEDSDTRNYAVMINCLNAALPQSGINKAHIVYELMVEGGITRMLAIFKDQDVDKIGSIRSARMQYLGYALENDAIYAHAGGAVDALEAIKTKGVDDIDVDGKYGKRDKTLKRAFEHTLFTSTELLNKGAKAKKFSTTTKRKNLLTYSVDEIDLSKYEGSQKINKVSINYSNYRTSNYTYDEATKTYLRSMNNTENVDLVTGERYSAKNIIVYGVKYTTYSYAGYNGYQRIDNIGTGEGYYISNGYAVPITWEKKSESEQTVYKIKATNEELVVNDGNTYIQIYPSNSGKLTMS